MKTTLSKLSKIKGKIEMKSLISVVLLIFIFGFYIGIYPALAYSSSITKVDNFARTYAYARRTIIFNATQIGGSSVETITLTTREPLQPQGSLGAKSQLSKSFIEAGYNEDLKSIFYSPYNRLLRGSNGEGFTIDLSNASTYVMDPLGNGTTQWYNVSNQLNPFTTSLAGTGTSYTCVLSSPRTLMNYWCAHYGYSSPVLINNTVDIDTVYQANNYLTGKTVEFVAIGLSEPMNASAPVGSISTQWSGYLTGLAIAAAALILIVGIVEMASIFTTGNEFFTNIFGSLSNWGGTSGNPFPENNTIQFVADPVAQQIMGEAWTNYTNGDMNYSTFLTLWQSYLDATASPASLSLGYDYTDNSADKGIDIFTTITVFVKNLIVIVLAILFLGITIYCFTLVIRFKSRRD